jgi:peptidoglycan/xylan/chitin deacetylase (PgdA/CDA1 family)
MMMRSRVLVIFALTLSMLAGCAGGPEGQATPTLSADQSQSPSQVASPSSAGSPSALPTPSASPSPRKSTPPSSVPSPAQPPAQPIGCTSPRVDLGRGPAGGSGPGGSLNITGTEAVALTFDDGPDPEYTPKILDLLSACGVKATFCVVGFRARDNPDLVRRIAREGHTLCNHSWQHLFDLAAKHDDAYILRDLDSTNNAIRNAVPGAKIEYFRAPGGNFTTRLVRLASTLGMKSIYWHIDPRDWDSATYGTGTKMQQHIITEIQTKVRPGSIILSHDLNKPNTIAAYRVLLPWLKQRVTLAALPNSGDA